MNDYPRSMWRAALFFTLFASACASSHVIDDGGTDAATPDHGAVVSLAVGDQHACVVRADGTVDCWGRSAFFGLGDWSTPPHVTPVEIPGVHDAVEVGAGSTGTCIRHRDLTVSCWGRLAGGALPFTAAPSSPLGGITNAVALAVGENSACVVRRSGRVSCWGSNTAGQLGDGHLSHGTASMDWSADPVDVVGLTNIVDLAVGGDHACAIDMLGRMFCWGDGHFGTLGVDPLTLPSCTGFRCATPLVAAAVPVGGVEISAGSLQSCVIGPDTFPRCWGLNSGGALGSGTFSGDPACRDTEYSLACTFVPVRVELAGTVQLAAARGNVCARVRDGTVACWGVASGGILGAGPSEFPPCGWPGVSDICSPAPVTIPDIIDAIEVRVGRFTACAVRAGGAEVVCWGTNMDGILGDGVAAHAHVCLVWGSMFDCSFAPVVVALP